jgi:hypothetical protein
MQESEAPASAHSCVIASALVGEYFRGPSHANACAAQILSVQHPTSQLTLLPLSAQTHTSLFCHRMMKVPTLAALFLATSAVSPALSAPVGSVRLCSYLDQYQLIYSNIYS